jgi:hypothetical protein
MKGTAHLELLRSTILRILFASVTREERSNTWKGLGRWGEEPALLG